MFLLVGRPTATFIHDLMPRGCSVTPKFVGRLSWLEYLTSFCRFDVDLINTADANHDYHRASVTQDSRLPIARYRAAIRGIDWAALGAVLGDLGATLTPTRLPHRSPNASTDQSIRIDFEGSDDELCLEIG